MSVRGDDQTSVFGNGAAVDELRILVDEGRQVGRPGSHGEAVVGGGRHHAGDLDSIGQKRFQHQGAEIPRSYDRAFHQAVSYPTGLIVRVQPARAGAALLNRAHIVI
ncbi:hypothetical protein [Caballeronia sp. M23-90]